MVPPACSTPTTKAAGEPFYLWPDVQLEDVMDIKVTGSEKADVIAVSGRVDSIEAQGFEKALQDANQRGKYNLVIDMSQLEYMSSAGFRALAAAQRNSQRHRRGDVVLVQVPALVHEALDLVGFAEHFMTFDDVASALAYLEEDAAGPG
jgi:anti-sigma B factor antagonist